MTRQWGTKGGERTLTARYTEGSYAQKDTFCKVSGSPQSGQLPRCLMLYRRFLLVEFEVMHSRLFAWREADRKAIRARPVQPLLAQHSLTVAANLLLRCHPFRQVNWKMLLIGVDFKQAFLCVFGVHDITSRRGGFQTGCCTPRQID